MTAMIDQVLSEAMMLQPEERARVAAELLATLEPDTPAERRSEAERLTEVERRARAAMAGEPGRSWEEAQAIIRKRLDAC